MISGRKGVLSRAYIVPLVLVSLAMLVPASMTSLLMSQITFSSIDLTIIRIHHKAHNVGLNFHDMTLVLYQVAETCIF
jgi:hypothetical protein